LIRSYEWFGGVASETLVDNQKAAVLEHRSDGKPRFNERFLDFAVHYGFQPRACKPARAQTKGKDERMVGYIKHHFFVRYRDFASWVHLNQLAEQWLREEADERVQGTVKEIVRERFAREAPRLQPLPRTRYDTSYREARQVGWDAFVDVRGNPGGLLSAAVDVSDRFVGSGIVVSTKGRNPMEDYTHRAQAQNTWRVPLVVLIDENSASASEIFAAAISDHGRGTIVGRQSYGKGSVQGIFPLNVSDGGVRLTTARFYSPLGRAISHGGVKPHVKVEQLARPADVENHEVFDPKTDNDVRVGIQIANRAAVTQNETTEQIRSLAGR